MTYLAEAAARIAIVETTSTGTALAVSKVMPYAVGGLLALWMVIYGRHARRQGERLAAAQSAAAQTAAQSAAPTAAPDRRRLNVATCVRHAGAGVPRAPPRRSAPGPRPRRSGPRRDRG